MKTELEFLKDIQKVLRHNQITSTMIESRIELLENTPPMKTWLDSDLDVSHLLKRNSQSNDKEKLK